jgi:hypothetical protein
MAGLMDLLAGKIEGPMMEGLQQFTGLLQHLKTGIESGLSNDKVLYGKMEAIQMLITERLDKLERELVEMREHYGTAFATPSEAAREGDLSREIAKVETQQEVTDEGEERPWPTKESKPSI